MRARITSGAAGKGHEQIMHTAVYDSIDEIGARRIEPLEGARLDFSYGLLRAIERSLWGDLTVKYLAVEAGDEMLAFTPIYIGANLNFNALLPGFVQSGYAALIKFFGQKAAYRIAVVGCLISDYGWIPMLRGGDARGIVKLMLPEIDRVAGAQGAHFCMLKDIRRDFPAIAEFVAAGYTQGFSLPTVSVPTAFKSFEDYVQNRSKNGRKHARKNGRKADGKLALKTVADFSDLVPAVYPFFRRTFLKAKYQFEELSPRFFAECARSTQPRTELVICEKAGRIVGATLNFYDAQELQIKRVGVDYEQEETALIYNMMMYQGLRNAIERGIPRVSLGQSTYLPKTRLGGEMDDLYLFLKGYSAATRASFPAQRLWMERYRAERVLTTLQGDALA